MAYSDSFPAVRPVFQADFANGGKIDPRATFTRSDTPPTYAAPSAVHYWSNEKHLSSENLFLQSSDFDTSWTVEFLGLTGSQTDPAGGTNGWTIEENATTSYHRLIQSISSGSADYGLVFYAKQNTGTRYLTLALVTGNNNYEAATFDLAGGSPVMSSGSSSSFTSVSATQTASGNGYYKCVLKATGSPVDARISLVNSSSPTLTSYGSFAYAGDGSSSIDIAFASLSTTGATDYNATTTSIHRQYAPSLKSVATAGQPRFEYTTDGQSMGILIEGAATNLSRYGSALASWANMGSGARVESNVAIAPNGSLEADFFGSSVTTPAYRFVGDYSISITSGTTYTASVYLKAAGHRYAQVSGISTGWATTDYVNYDLQTGTVSAGGSATGTLTDVGNGWFRATATMTANGSVTGSFLLGIISGMSDTRTPLFTANEYDGILTWGFQTEASSFASSLVDTGTGSSALTRAADSLSVGMSAVGVSQGPVSVVLEGSAGSGRNPNLISLSDGTAANRWAFYRDSLTADTSTDYRLFVRTDSSSVVSKLVSGSASATKFAMRIDTDNYAVCAGGGTVETDTAGVAPVTTTIHIADDYNGGNQANGHIKRLALYGDLSDTNLQALTS